MAARGFYIRLRIKVLQGAAASRHRTADKVEDFGCDLLLAALVVCEGEFGNEVLSIVCSDLHRHGTGGMLRSIGIQNDSIHL